MSVKLNFPKQGQLVVIKWFDAWQDANQSGGPETVQTVDMHLMDVGFFVMEKDRYVVIAQEKNADSNDYRHYHYIPKVNIISMKEAFTS